MLRKVIEHLLMGRRILQPLWERLKWLSLYGMCIGGGSKVSDSGELWVIDYFDKHLPPDNGPAIVFDVGSGVGGYAREVISRLGRRVKLYCFEPSKKTFEQLVRNPGNHENVELFNFGFGNKEESVTLYSDAEGSRLGSIYNRRLDHFNNGAKSLIGANSIDFIQFEFGGCNIDSRTYF